MWRAPRLSAGSRCSRVKTCGAPELTYEPRRRHNPLVLSRKVEYYAASRCGRVGPPWGAGGPGGHGPSLEGDLSFWQAIGQVAIIAACGAIATALRARNEARAQRQRRPEDLLMRHWRLAPGLQHHGRLVEPPARVRPCLQAPASGHERGARGAPPKPRKYNY